MACTLVQGYELDCRDAVGGIKNVYLTEFANVPSTNITASSGVITAMSCSSGKKFWKYALEKENGEFMHDTKSSVENGTLFYEQKVTFTTKKMSASQRNNLHNLAQNRLLCIVEDNNGKAFLLGQVNGVDVTNIAGKSGKAFGDLNGYTIELLGKEASAANEVTYSLLTTLQVAA